MPTILKPVAVHSIVGNAPYITSVHATASPATVRTFTGIGAPSSSTLLAGNGMYNATASGFAINASLHAAGSGYVVNDVLTGSGGTGTGMQITVDMVTSTGAIVDFHISRIGSYSAYPGATMSTTGGTGSGATFYLNIPNPDYYIDITTSTSPVLYVCITSGNYSTSIWSKISGGGGGTQQFKVMADGGDYWICYTWDGTTLGSTQVNVAKPYRLRCTNGITSYTARGVTYTYSFTGSGNGLSPFSASKAEYQRNTSGSDGSSATEVLTPAVLPGDYITAISYTTTAPSTLVGVAWMYLGPSDWGS